MKKFRHLSEMIRQRLENEEQNLAIVEVDEIVLHGMQSHE